MRRVLKRPGIIFGYAYTASGREPQTRKMAFCTAPINITVHMKATFTKIYEIRDYGEPESFLGMEVTHDRVRTSFESTLTAAMARTSSAARRQRSDDNDNNKGSMQRNKEKQCNSLHRQCAQ